MPTGPKGSPGVGRGNRRAPQGHEVGRADQHEPVDPGSSTALSNEYPDAAIGPE